MNLIQVRKTMLSTEIAALTGKRHDHVIRDIKVIIDKLSNHELFDSPNLGSGFKSSSYLAGNGKNEFCYELDYESTLIVVTGYDVSARAKVIKRWLELEQSAVKIQTPPDMVVIANQFEGTLKLAALFNLSGNQALIHTNRAVKNLTGIDCQKILGVDLVSDKKELTYTPTDLGKMLGLSPIKANKLLEEKGFQTSVVVGRSKEWCPTEKGKPYCEVIDTGVPHSSRMVKQIRWFKSIIDVLK